MSLERAADLIRQADSLVITAGAGFGVDSGLPDFRGNQGFWRAYPALAQAGIEFTAIASPSAFRALPRLAWGFYGHRLSLYRKTTPHAGFAILRRWAQAKPAHVFTSNVDGHFTRAGFEEVYECHGSIHHLQCATPCGPDIWPADDFFPEVDEVACQLTSAVPLCPRCGKLARPNILMFGDGEWISWRSQAQRERLDFWLAQVRKPVVIEMGAGTAIPSVRYFGEARQVPLIRINPREPQVPRGSDVGLPLGALAALEALDRLLER